MLSDRVSNPGPLTYESCTLPIALRGPAQVTDLEVCTIVQSTLKMISVVYNGNKQHTQETKITDSVWVVLIVASYEMCSPDPEVIKIISSST